MLTSLRQQIIDEISLLDDQQATSLLAFIRAFHPSPTKATYDPAIDPVLTGELTFIGSPDLAAQSSEILRQEFGAGRNHDHGS